jgi:hypothetical protein
MGQPPNSTGIYHGCTGAFTRKGLLEGLMLPDIYIDQAKSDCVTD